MTITTVQWVSIAVGVLIAVAATFRIPALRTAPVTNRMHQSMRSSWPFGEALLRGWIRMTPTAIGGLWIILAALAVGVPSAGAEPGSALYVLGYALVLLILMFVIWVVALVSIVLLNRPALLVAPHLRSEPGAIAMWLRRKPPQGRSTRR